MIEKEFIELLENSNQPLQIFKENIENLPPDTIIELAKEKLSGREILELFKIPSIKKWKSDKKKMLTQHIKDEKTLITALKNNGVTRDIYDGDIFIILQGLSDDGKLDILRTSESIINKLPDYNRARIIDGMGNTKKLEILSNREFVEKKLRLDIDTIVDLIAESTLEANDKKNLMDIYQLDNRQRLRVVKKFNDFDKGRELIQNSSYNKEEKIELLISFDIQSLIDFINKNTTFSTDVKVYEVIMQLDVKRQLEFISNLDKVHLTESEKKEIIVTLKDETKKKIPILALPDALKPAITIKTRRNTGKIILDLNRKLEDYRGLDSLLYVNPTQFEKEDRDKFMILCGICPSLTVVSTLNNKAETKRELYATAMDYIITEEWIQNLLNQLKPEYAQRQKMAIIDKAFGKRVSYSPDYDTEVWNPNSCRSIYKILSTGYGVCNGIAAAAEYVYNRAGMKCEIVGSKTHIFLKFKDVEFELDNGETIVGNTLVDTTWDLAANMFDGKPNCFCISYEEARKGDIDRNGIDRECHKNDEELQDATFNLDDKSLRKLFQSIGLADENGNFPIKKLYDVSKQLHKQYAKSQPAKDIEQQFVLLSKYCPKFAICQRSTMEILVDVLLNDESLKYSKCIVNRVYNKLDTKKRPVMYVYIKWDNIGEKFYYADESEGKFIGVSKDIFLRQFECYKKDLEANNGIRPWETTESISAQAVLTLS